MNSKNFWQGKKVFVTGHTGFKGTWLTRWLSMLGADVIGYSLAPTADLSMFNVLKNDDIKSVIGDIRDYEMLRTVLMETNPDIIFHLAAQPLVRQSYKDPRATYEVNVMGTVNLLECMRHVESLRSAVIVTTDKVYQNKEWCWGYRESDELGGRDPYSCSKSCVEMVVESFCKSFFDSNNIIRTARAGNVIGGGDWSDDRLIPDCIRASSSGNKIIIRNPESVRPWQHVLEPLYGYMILAERIYEGSEISPCYNFGPDDRACVTTEALVKIFCDNWRGASYLKNEDANTFHESGILKLDCSKAKSELGWIPVWDIKTAVGKTVQWYEAYYSGEDMNKVTEMQINSYMEAIL